MDWIKVLNKHVILEYTDLSDSEFRAWITIMSLAAEIEHEPTHEQMLKNVHHKTLTSLQDKLKKHSTSLQDILKKVLIDAQEVADKRKAWRDKKKIKREDRKNVPKEVQGDVSGDVPDREGEGEGEGEGEKTLEAYVETPVSTCPHQEIISLYHEVLPELPPVKLWTPQRQAILRQRWVESPERQCMEWWREYFKKIRGSPFLMGKEKDFRADLEWIIRPKNMPKIIEGRYSKRNGNGNRHAGIKSWLERDNEKSGQDQVCEGDGGSGGDFRPGERTL